MHFTVRKSGTSRLRAVSPLVFASELSFLPEKWNKVAETLGVFGFYTYLCQRKRKKGKYQSGQMGQTVNLLAYAFGGSNPSLPTFRRRN